MPIKRPFSEDCDKARRRLLAARREQEERERAFNEVSGRFGSDIYTRRLRASRAADEAANRARAAMLEACDDETSRIDLPSGTKVIIHAKADPFEVKKILDILRDEIPAEDLEELDIARLEGAGSGRSTDVPKPDGTTERREVSGEFTVLEDGRTIIKDFYPHSYRTVKHEIGHHVYNKLSPDEKTRWKNKWEELKSSGKLPTDYAGKNEKEGFAELYEYFRNELPLDDEARDTFAPFVRPNPQKPSQHADDEED